MKYTHNKGVGSRNIKGGEPFSSTGVGKTRGNKKELTEEHSSEKKDERKRKGKGWLRKQDKE